MVLKSQFTVQFGVHVLPRSIVDSSTLTHPLLTGQEKRYWEVNAGDIFSTFSTFPALTDQPKMLFQEGRATKEPKFPLTADIQACIQTNADLRRDKQLPVNSPQPFTAMGGSVPPHQAQPGQFRTHCPVALVSHC